MLPILVLYLCMQTKDIGNFVLYSDGRVYKKKKNRFLPGSPNSDGYLHVYVDGKNWKLHRLIAETFIPNPNNFPVINHKDGNKKNNNIDNLEWCTQGDNVRHAFKNGLMVRHKGSKNSASKLKEEQIIEIKQKLLLGNSMNSISKLYNVSLSCIFLIKKGRNWGHIKV